MFKDVSGLLPFNPSRRYSGIAVTDLDGDNRFEFIVAAVGGPNRVLRWMGGQLRDATPPRLADAAQSSVGLAAGDIDGDGREELYLVNAGLPNETEQSTDRLFKFQMDGLCEDLFARPENQSVRNALTGRSVAAIDRRGIGRYGFAVSNQNRPMRLYELGQNGVLADLAAPLGLAFSNGGAGILTIPIITDQPDIICLNDGAPNSVFRNQGDGTFFECASVLGLADPNENSRCIVAFDANADAELDLGWGNWDGPHRVMTRDADGTWFNGASAGVAFPTSVNTVIAADFDNDGHDELFFNNADEANRLFRVRGSAGRPTRGESKSDGSESPDKSKGRGNSSRLPEFEMLDPAEALDPEGHGTGAAVCDIDGDGVLELLVARDSQPLGLFKARQAESNNWLRIRPLTRYNAPARGAVVHAEACGRVSVKAICGGSGYRCQMEPVAHFGLGPNGKADRVQVTWPDGASVLLLNPGKNRTITVPYPRG